MLCSSFTADTAKRLQNPLIRWRGLHIYYDSSRERRYGMSEASITINGTKLTDDDSRMVRLALESFADILANELGFKDEGIELTDRYQTGVARIRALIDGKAPRTQ
jgi:hypothetical protein